MIISPKKILELNQKYNLIENLSERESKQPEGVGFDIRVGEIYSMSGSGYLGIEERRTPDIKKVADIKNGDKKFVLQPGDFVIVKTIEKVNLPSEKVVVEEGKEPTLIMIHIYARSTLHRSAIHFMGTKTDPGYSGELTFALANMGKSKFELELGARIVNIVFMQVIGDMHRAYEGQWKGGRVSTSGTEKQN